jgi:hypothetical protein
MTRPPPASRWSRWLAPFFALTREERQILCLILALALLGLAAWTWHTEHAGTAPRRAAVDKPRQ